MSRFKKNMSAMTCVEARKWNDLALEARLPSPFGVINAVFEHMCGTYAIRLRR